MLRGQVVWVAVEMVVLVRPLAVLVWRVPQTLVAAVEAAAAEILVLGLRVVLAGRAL
jgi:hypothetical protein